MIVSDFGKYLLRRSASAFRRLPLRVAAVLLVLTCLNVTPPAAAAAAETSGDTADGIYGDGRFSHWWLPINYSEHGDPIDALFYGIFWTTMAVFVLVEVALVYFMIKYRRRPDKKKAVFSHGNTRLEMAWTLAPAVILLVLSLASKRAWDDYRYAQWATDPDRAQVLVVGEQFKWNVVYPGPDGQLGRYLVYPKPTDPKYRAMKYKRAVQQIQTDMRSNLLGRDTTSKDPVALAGKDDDLGTPGRPLILPSETKIDIHLSSKDVLHDFYLPNFRVKLDAVPGMRGHIYFIANKRSTATKPVDQVPADRMIWLDRATPKTLLWGNPKTFEIYDPLDIAPDAADPYQVDPNTLDPKVLRKRLPSTRSKRKFPWLSSLDTLRGGAAGRLRRKLAAEIRTNEPKLKPAEVEARVGPLMTDARIEEEVRLLRADLTRMGITELNYVEQPFEIVCEELCGNGHYSMNGMMIVVSPQQYRDFINKDQKPGGTKPPAATQPAVAAAGGAGE